MTTPLEQYQRLAPEVQRIFDEINFLAAELRDHLLLEQFYLTVAALTARLQQLHPQIPCPQGCHDCCQTQGSRWQLLPLEWDLLAKALQALAPAQLAVIQAQLQTASSACPLLVDGQCSVYAFRPLDCRLKGYSFEQEQTLPMARPVLRPYTCVPEQQRMQAALAQPEQQLYYMFFPQRHTLREVLSRIEPTAAGRPRSLNSLLADYFAAVSD